MKRNLIVVAAGGTAGHVLPAISFAKELEAIGIKKQHIKFIGSKTGIENKLVPQEGYSLVSINGRGITRKVSLDSLFSIFKLVIGIFEAIARMGFYRPRAVVSFGGYGGLACSIAAVVWKVPLVIAESNAVPGAANKLMAPFAKVNIVAFDSTNLPNKELLGNPIRPQIQQLQRNLHTKRTARQKLNLPPDSFVVAIFGGSLGAHHLNEVTRKVVTILSDHKDIAIRHIVGKRDWQEFSKIIDTKNLVYQVVEYQDDMASLYAACDIVISRAGGTTVAEITALGIPAILVPLPNSPGDHQSANAKALSDAGGVIVIKDSDLRAEDICFQIEQLSSNPLKLNTMSQSLLKIGHKDAAQKMAMLVDKIASPTKISIDSK